MHNKTTIWISFFDPYCLNEFHGIPMKINHKFNV